MSDRVTLVDVARAAEVDVSLVSRILRGQQVKVRDETRTRILDQAQRLGYRPHAIARSLKTAKAGAFGLVIPTFDNPVFAQIIMGAEAAAAQLNCVMMTTSGEGWSRNNWLEALDGGRVDGLLIAGGPTLEPANLRVPYLLVNRAVSGIDRSVVLDDEKASRMAVDHLVELGHRRIVFVGGPAGADTANRRLAGFESARIRAGLESLGDPVSGNYTVAGGKLAMQRILASGMTFTGVVAANLPSAVGALQAVQEAGLHVPERVSIVAIHDAEIAEMVRPRLTTIQMPLTQLGARGIELLSTIAPSAEVNEVVGQPMRLVLRDSTGTAP